MGTKNSKQIVGDGAGTSAGKRLADKKNVKYYATTPALREIGVPLAVAAKLLKKYGYPENITVYHNNKPMIPEHNLKDFARHVEELRKKYPFEPYIPKKQYTSYKTEILEMFEDLCSRIGKIEARLDDISAKIHG